MGNCQATDAECIVIQHPSGKEERVCWSVSASKVMRMNPGHHVALILSTTTFGPSNGHRLTRIKLLHPNDMLLLGHVYRLITAQEVMKGFLAKKHEKMKKTNAEKAEKLSGAEQPYQVKNQRARDRMTANQSARRSRIWQPSLQSISEASS